MVVMFEAQVLQSLQRSTTNIIFQVTTVSHAELLWLFANALHNVIKDYSTELEKLELYADLIVLHKKPV